MLNLLNAAEAMVDAERNAAAIDVAEPGRQTVGGGLCLVIGRLALQPDVEPASQALAAAEFHVEGAQDFTEGRTQRPNSAAEADRQPIGQAAAKAERRADFLGIRSDSPLRERDEQMSEVMAGDQAGLGMNRESRRWRARLAVARARCQDSQPIARSGSEPEAPARDLHTDALSSPDPSLALRARIVRVVTAFEVPTRTSRKRGGDGFDRCGAGRYPMGLGEVRAGGPRLQLVLTMKVADGPQMSFHR